MGTTSQRVELVVYRVYGVAWCGGFEREIKRAIHTAATVSMHMAQQQLVDSDRIDDGREVEGK